MDDIRNRYRSSRGTQVSQPRPVNRPVQVGNVRPRPLSPAKPRAASTQTPPTTPKQNKPPVNQRPMPSQNQSAGYGFEPPASRPPQKQKRNKRPRRKRPVLVILLILALAGGGYFWMQRGSGSNNPYAIGAGTPSNPPAVAQAQTSTPQPQQQTAQPIKIVATGDMIAHDSVNINAKKADGSYDYLPLMKDMKPFFEKADVRFCNQSTPAGGAEFGITGYPVFNAPIEFARGIEAVGCNVVNIGTNHTNDKGQKLIDATVAAWDNRDDVLAVAGANRTAEEQKKVRYFTVEGIKFAFLSYSTYSNNTNLTAHGLNMYSDELATSQVTEAKKEADIVMVSMRWGTEYSPGINASQQQIAKKLAGLGVDVVLGHGPHVLEPVQKVAGKNGHEAIVWYSLGNFLNTQLEAETLVGGFAVMELDPSTKKLSIEGFMPTYTHYDWTAEQSQRVNANDLLARKNVTMVPLDKAESLLKKSHLNTTVKAQTDRVKSVLNKHTEVPILTSSQY